MKFNLLKNKDKILKNNKEKSTGRSMVEMLGVLAIIGVLSIGGISGYTIAMRKYRANEIANLIMKYASVSYLAIQSRMNISGDVRLGGSYYGESFPVYQCYKREYGDYAQCDPSPFADVGLGGLPNGVERLYIYTMFSPTDASGSNSYYSRVKMKPGNYADMGVRFTDKELCKAVAHLFDGYNDSDGQDGVYCDFYSFRKLIPVE